MGVLNIVVDLRTRQVTCSVDIDAPREGKSTTKVNWLVRLLKSANDKARLECTVLSQRGTGASDLLGPPDRGRGGRRTGSGTLRITCRAGVQTYLQYGVWLFAVLALIVWAISAFQPGMRWYWWGGDVFRWPQ